MSQAQALRIQRKPSSSPVKLGLAWLISTPTHGVWDKFIRATLPYSKCNGFNKSSTTIRLGPIGEEKKIGLKIFFGDTYNALKFR